MDAEREQGENKTPGSTYHIEIRQASAIVFGDGSNVYSHSPLPRVSSPVDPDRHIYDFPPEVENDQKITQQQEGHAIARQKEGYEERYQRRREQNEKEKRHGCLNTDVLPHIPADHQQCQQSLNPGHAEAIVDTGAAGFLKNINKSIKKFDDTAGPLLEQQEQLILQVVLPWLEESWRKPDSSRQVVYETLAKLSRSRASPKLVRCAIQQLHRLMLLDTLESGKGSLVGVEKIIRLSICSHDATFKKEGLQEKELRLSVYHRILALLIFQQIKGSFFTVDIVKTKLLECQDCLAKYTNQMEGSFQFSKVFIQEAIRYLLKPNEKSEKSNVRAFLNECRANIETQVDDSEILSFLHKLQNPEWVKKMNKNRNNWLAVHCVILYFYEKAHSSESHESQLQINRRAVDLLQRVIKAYIGGGGGNDWRFCLLPATVVSELVMKEAIRDSVSEDSPYSITEEENGSVRERIISGDKLHHKRLLNLRHPNLCINLWMKSSPVRVMELISVASPLGNLKEYVLNGRCEETSIVTFLLQIASALQYLHENHIVHAGLRAEHVNVVEFEEGVLQVQIIRFGRSKSLEMRPGKDTSKSIVVSADMSPDSTRWSAPEVILQGHYSHASDVWSFGVVVWELYEALANRVRSREQTLPYFNITNDEILSNIQMNKLLHKPNCCPDWMYIIMQQCWRYNPKHRPPFIALLEHLTNRKTQQFLLMTENEEEPCRHKEDIETMGSYDFLTEHEYQQVPTMRSCEIRSLEAHCDKTFPVSKASKPLPLPPSETTEGYETFLVSKASKRLPLPPSETTERYEAFAASKANEGLPLPTSDTTEGYVLLSCKGSSNECPLPTLAATDDYDHLATNGISKKPTLPSPRSRGLATNDIQAKGHARLRETAI